MAENHQKNKKIMEKVIAICEKICPQTLTINAIAIGVSISDVEVALKLISYAVAIIWTSIKVIKELKEWNK